MHYDVPEGLGLRKIAATGQMPATQPAGNRPRFTPEQIRQLSNGLAMGHALGYEIPKPPTKTALATMPVNSRDQTWRQNANIVIRRAIAPFGGIIRNAPNSVKSQAQGFVGNLSRLQRPQVLGTMVDNAMIDASTHIRPEDKQAVRNLREQQRRKWFKNGQYVGPKQGPYYDAARMANQVEPDVTGVF